MAYYLTKIAVTALLVVLISEVAKRSSVIGAILASVPLTSVLAIFWLYLDTGDVQKISGLALDIFWLVLPSLALFLLLPVLLNLGIDFYLSMTLSIAGTVVCYFLMIFALRHFGIDL